jgi:glyoxylase-like metal-dependent hydrolase (beta-lactamase superfamily II)
MEVDMAVKIMIGDAEVYALADGRHPMDLKWHYPSIDAAEWEPWTAGVQQTLHFGAFLVRHAGQTALIDTGWGPDWEPPGGLEAPASLLDELTAIGVAPEDVDVVVLTHLHPDHIGWNLVRDGDPDTPPRPRFPRAPYLVAEAEWEHYAGRARDGDRLHPSIPQQALALEGTGALGFLPDGHEVIPGLRARTTPGHTPGHTSLVLTSAGETFVFLGDLAHHPAVLHETHWEQFFDWDPAQARASREALLEEVERNGWPAAAGHFPFPSLGRLGRDEQGRRVWEPLDV